MSPEESLKSLLRASRSQEIWHVSAGPSTGSTIVVDIGRKRRRKTPLTNPFLTEEQRQYEGEVLLYIECPWRVSTRTALICSWTDDNDIDGPMLLGLNRSLLGGQIKAARLSPVTMDLHLYLTNGTHLTVFCDSIGSGEDNYSVFDSDFVHIVGAGGKVRREPRSDNARPVLRGL